MGRHLQNVVAGQVVALHKHRAVGGDGHVPAHIAHLGDNLGGLQAHGLGLLPIGDGKALDGGVGAGVLRVGVAGLVVGGILDDALVQIDGGEHAAGVEVVHRPVAVANTDVGVHNVGAALV